ncbi:TPA: hypothetical protein EYP70_05230 [Candidatus Bathyarchaeota archaeon]|nr:hypothetical protein [Candidatus Bathyarchaeota archaeon]
MKFPEKVYTEDEVRLARSLVRAGYHHKLRVVGSKEFRLKVEEALKLVKKAGRYDFLRRYIRSIIEVDGFSQLREADASIWLNWYAVEDPIEAASFIIQKAWQMSVYLEGIKHYGHLGETAAISERIKFLRDLKAKSHDPKIKEECEKKLKTWEESVFL